MEISESHAQITQLQSQFSQLDEIQSGGLHLWPFIRFNELERFRNQSYTKTDFSKRLDRSEPVKIQRWVFRNRITKALKSLVDQYAGERRIGFLSFGTSYYSETINGKKFNRHIDPLFELCKEQFPESNLIKIHPDKDQGMSMLYPASFIPMNEAKALAYYYYRQAQWSGPVFDAFKGALESCGLGMLLERSKGDLDDCLAMVPVAQLILQRLHLSHLFVVCFYDLNVLPFVVAAKKLGIKVIDIQHGKQGDIDHVYSHNPAIDAMREMYPDYFWNWGQPSANAIDRWFKNPENSPKCLVGGNVFTQKWLNPSFDPEFEDKNLLTEKRAKFHRSVMFCGGPIDAELPELLIKYITANPETLVFIRLHPAVKNQMEAIKAQVPFENVEIELATRSPLYAMFKSVDCLITAWSSVCIEGLYFEVPTIIIHENGLSLYRQYISQGLFGYAADSKSMESLIDEVLTAKVVYQDDFIETNPDVAKRTLKEILES